MQSPARLVELDPLTHRPKRRKPTVRRLSDLNLGGTPKVIRLWEIARDHRAVMYGELVFARSLRLATYASNLNDAIEGRIVPGDDAPTGREPQAVGELDEQRTRRVNIELVAAGCTRCIETGALAEALTRLGSLFGDLGIEWRDGVLTISA